MAFFKIINKSINKKIFIITSIILILCSITIYMGIIYEMPRYYSSYKREEYKEICSEFTNKLEMVEYNNSGGLFSDFIEKYKNTMNQIFIFDSKGKYKEMPYNPNRSYVVTEGLQSITDFIAQECYNYYNDYSIVDDKNDTTPRLRIGVDRKLVLITKDEFNTSDGKYTIYYSFTLQPINEASEVLINFIPYILVFIMLNSFIIAWIYAKKVTKPIIEISNKAKVISSTLDLSIRCNIKGNDEVAILGNSLNQLAENLSESLDEIKEKNDILREEILREKDREKRRLDFFNAASHELKTPITILRGQLEGMLFKVGIYKDRKKYLLHSRKVINRMKELVKELYNISQLEDKSVSLKLSIFNASDLLKIVVGELDELIISKNMKISINIEEGLLVEGDKHLIMLVVSNVIKNAIIHSPENERINITFQNYILTVENYSVEIPKEEINNIFNPYYRVDKSRNRNSGGTGLGLYIVKEILDQHNYEFNIRSGKNKVIFQIVFCKLEER